MTAFQRAFYHGLLLALVICWSPFKALAYVAPLIVVLWICLEARSMAVLRNLAIGVLVWALFIISHSFAVTGFAYTSSLLTVVTYSTVAVFICIPARELGSDILYERTSRVLAWTALLQGVFGLVQALAGFAYNGSFDLDNGDWVAGTINPSLTADRAFSNPMFAANMAFMLLALMPGVVARRRHLLAVAVGSLALMLSSVIHALVFLVVGITVSYLLIRPRLGRGLGTIALVGVAVVSWMVASTFLTTNLGLLPRYARDMVEGTNPRTLVVQRSVTTMLEEYPFMAVAGLGPGQFSSRAALIGTGLYFGGPLRSEGLGGFPTAMSAPFEHYLLDLWLVWASQSWYGSTHQPFFSWLSVYTEFGLAVVMIIVVAAMRSISRLRAVARDQHSRWVALAASSAILLLLLLGFQENYFEVPQAILIGSMLIKLLYANVVYQKGEQVTC